MSLSLGGLVQYLPYTTSNSTLGLRSLIQPFGQRLTPQRQFHAVVGRLMGMTHHFIVSTALPQKKSQVTALRSIRCISSRLRVLRTLP
ncbi:MAG: hypothetical protein CM15mP74_37220 [Halieaceae bacterium]|nr:MAG: hypothetical protein CM15mP74_37220 [Halieaceae bacterium]